jgi:hypothetical protein
MNKSGCPEPSSYFSWWFWGMKPVSTNKTTVCMEAVCNILHTSTLQVSSLNQLGYRCQACVYVTLLLHHCAHSHRIFETFLFHIFLAFWSSLQHCDEALFKECDSGFWECNIDGLIILSTSIGVGGYTSATLPPGRRPSTRCTGDWVGPRANLDGSRISCHHHSSVSYCVTLSKLLYWLSYPSSQPNC